MAPKASAVRAPKAPRKTKRVSKAVSGSQTLLRGLDVLEAVSGGTTNLIGLAKVLRLNRSTAHRLAATLVEQRYLRFTPRVGYALGSKLLELGYRARDQLSFPRIAREHIQALAASTGDTVHLGVLENTRALYLDKISGSRRVDVRSHVGDRHPLRSTGLGKALILDFGEARWRELYEVGKRDDKRYPVSLSTWIKRMREYAKEGYALDLEENEDQIRCVAAPVRDATDLIVGAISISSAAQYMNDARMKKLSEEVRATARAISADLGWRVQRASRASKAH